MPLRSLPWRCAAVLLLAVAVPAWAGDGGLQLDVDAGIAAERLRGVDATAFGPMVSAHLEAGPGIYAGARVGRFDYRSDSAADGWRSNVGRVEAGGITSVGRDAQLVAGVEAAYRDANWRPTRWDYGVSAGLRSVPGPLETEVRALYRYPDHSGDDPQVGARVAIAGYDSERRYGVVLSGDYLTDERHVLLALRRHF